MASRRLVSVLRPTSATRWCTGGRTTQKSNSNTRLRVANTESSRWGNQQTILGVVCSTRNLRFRWLGLAFSWPQIRNRLWTGPTLVATTGCPNPSTVSWLGHTSARLSRCPGPAMTDGESGDTSSGLARNVPADAVSSGAILSNPSGLWSKSLVSPCRMTASRCSPGRCLHLGR